VDSLAVQLPGDVWVLERPTELTVTDSAATVTGLVLQGAYGSGKLVLEGALPTRGRAAAHLQLEGFPLVGLYALLERDTAGVGGRADSVDLSVLEALTPSLQRVTGVFSADLGIAGTWDAPRLRGELQIATAGATIPTLNVRYEDVTGRLTFSGDTIAIQSLAA